MNIPSLRSGPGRELLYATDPLCGWCFAFGPTVDAVRRALPASIPIRVVTGCLVPERHARPAAETADAILDAMTDVEEIAGVGVGEAFEDLVCDSNWVLRSEPACRAIHVVAALAPERTLDMVRALHEGLFVRGQRTDALAVLEPIVAGLGLDRVAFRQAWSSLETASSLAVAFGEVHDAGLASYPALWWREGSTLVPITTAWLPEEDVLQRLAAVLPADG